MFIQLHDIDAKDGRTFWCAFDDIHWMERAHKQREGSDEPPVPCTRLILTVPKPGTGVRLAIDVWVNESPEHIYQMSLKKQ